VSGEWRELAPVRSSVDNEPDTDAHGWIIGVSCSGAWKTPQDGAAARSGGGSMATGGTGLADAKTAIRAPRVAILTATSPERVEFYHAATQSKQCYAARHGCVSAIGAWKTRGCSSAPGATLVPQSSQRLCDRRQGRATFTPFHGTA
jgi:hypothetical protein